jgi:hypothetical protein
MAKMAMKKPTAKKAKKGGKPSNYNAAGYHSKKYSGSRGK